MGADLYIKSIHDKVEKVMAPLFEAAVKRRESLPEGLEKEEAQEEINTLYREMYSVKSGYYRCSYNNAAFAWWIGLSWWADVQTKCKNGVLDKEGILWLIDRVSVEIPEMTKEELEGRDCVTDKKDNSPAEWRKSFIAQRDELVELLRLALDLGENVYCSL